MKQKQNIIIFCQGDKKELEEIIGEEYEYIHIKERRLLNRTKENMKSRFDHSRVERKKLATYLECCGTIGREAEWNLFSLAQEVKADAIIHYTGPFPNLLDLCDEVAEGGEETSDYGKEIRGIYIVRGTPVRRKKRN